MNEFSLILNTGVQFYELEKEVVIDFGTNIMKALRFYEYTEDDKILVDPVYYFPENGKYLRRQDLMDGNYIDPYTDKIAEYNQINPNMNWLTEQDLLSVNRLNMTLGDKRKSGLEYIENQWLPMPMYEMNEGLSEPTPTNWFRIKILPVKDKSTAEKKVYRIVLAFDTTENTMDANSAPTFNGQPFKRYALCGVTQTAIRNLSRSDQNTMTQVTLPMRAYTFCDVNNNVWFNAYLQDMFSCTELLHFEPGQRMKYLAYYIYLITYLHNLDIIPSVKLYNDQGQTSIHTNLVLDVGNSRTFGLVAEDPINSSFSNSTIIELRDLETGEVYRDPFDMRLCFKDERFGFNSGDGQFRWPSLVRLGKEAQRNIYNGDADLLLGEQFDTSHSSPKRYLWDHKAYTGQWNFVTEKNREVGPTKTVCMDGIMQQFHSDGSFAADPGEMGEHSNYSRGSLMTFCFMEILLQVKMQINGVDFRRKNGEEGRKRDITRVIITCPTAMSREEQRTLRQCMQEASVVLRRYYDGSYLWEYNPEEDHDKIEIIPSVRDLSLSVDNIDQKRSWNYDEATCCQMVYLYSELRRYLGNSQEFFSLYGRRRNNDAEPSLTVASIDIGAGTTDIMICNYKNEGISVVPMPLFWDSFHLAGDDLVKRIITDVMLDFADPRYPGASGIITEKLRAIGCPSIPDTMHHFFSDTQAMGVIEKRMRKEFCIQVLIPIANYLLDLLQKDKEDCIVSYNDIFTNGRPSTCLMDFFARQMGFRFEDLPIKYSRDYLNEIVCKVFEPSFRKFAAIFYSYKCDIVLMGGRPCSIGQIYRLLLRLYSVSPNRLISMNHYRVGSWYPGSTDVGHFGDKKSMVAVGALISYLAENGKLLAFRLNTEKLRTKVTPTSEYIGLMEANSGALQTVLTPHNVTTFVSLSAFPVRFGCKQIDVPGYPSQMLYNLDFNEDYLWKTALDTLKRQLNMPADMPDNAIAPDYVIDEIDKMKFRAKQYSPLRIEIERDYYQDKEVVKILSIENANHDTIATNTLKLSLQSWAEDETNWLDTGVFVMRLMQN